MCSFTIPLYFPAPGMQEMIDISQNSDLCLRGRQSPCLADGRASQDLRAGGPNQAGASRSGTQVCGEEICGTSRVEPPGREQCSGSHMRLSQENDRELLLRSLSSPQLEGNRYCLKVLNITLNQQLAGAVTSPSSAAHLI